MSINLEELKRGIKAVIREELAREPEAPIESHVSHVCGCPDCYCGVIDKMNETSDYVCDNCGLPLGNKEFASKLPHCPNCGGDEVKKVEREEEG